MGNINPQLAASRAVNPAKPGGSSAFAPEEGARLAPEDTGGTLEQSAQFGVARETLLTPAEIAVLLRGGPPGPAADGGSAHGDEGPDAFDASDAAGPASSEAPAVQVAGAFDPDGSVSAVLGDLLDLDGGGLGAILALAPDLLTGSDGAGAANGGAFGVSEGGLGFARVDWLDELMDEPDLSGLLEGATGSGGAAAPEREPNLDGGAAGLAARPSGSGAAGDGSDMGVYPGDPGCFCGGVAGEAGYLEFCLLSGIF